MDSLSVDGTAASGMAGADFLGAGRHHRAISMKAKSVKMAEAWGEQTQVLRPISGRTRSSAIGGGDRSAHARGLTEHRRSAVAALDNGATYGRFGVITNSD